MSSTIQQFIKTLPEHRQAVFTQLHTLITTNAPDLKPYLQAPFMAYGKYHYKYKSGREGDWFTVGMRNNKHTIAIYITTTQNGIYIPEKYQQKLNAKVGKSCINFKKPEDINWDILKKAITEANQLYQPQQIQ